MNYENMSFEEQLTKSIKSKIIQEIGKTDILNISYQDRKQIPQDLIDKVWNSIDWSEVIEQIRPNVQTRICNSIIGNMEAELKTDIKKVLGVEGVRERLRMEIYPKIMNVLNDVD